MTRKCGASAINAKLLLPLQRLTMLALFSNSHIKVDRCIITSWHSRRWHLASPSERHPCRNRAPFDRCSFRCIHQITGRLYNFVLLGTKRGLTFSSNFLLHYFNKCIQSHKLRGVFTWHWKSLLRIRVWQFH